MNERHKVDGIWFGQDVMKIRIDEREHLFELKKISKKLLHATDLERNAYRVSASGYGIHWKLIDEDLSIDGLLEIKHTPNLMKDKFLEEKNKAAN